MRDRKDDRREVVHRHYGYRSTMVGSKPGRKGEPWGEVGYYGLVVRPILIEK